MKKLDKVLSIVVVALMLACIATNVFAAIDIDNVVKSGSTDANADNAMSKLGGTIVAYVTNAAMVIAVVMIAVLGIKYMLGSSEEKADYKKSLVPLLIGAILVFGAAAIAKIVVGLATSFK